MQIICENISKRFGDKLAVDGVDLTIEEGDIFGLLGPNGAGKSTLIKMMTGLIWPTGGSISIDGYDVHGEHLPAMRQVGAIIEWPAFIPYLTARKNLEILSGGRGGEFQRKMIEVVDFVEMRPNLDRKVERFSTGMKQRLGIALALLPESRFVILDEPTNGLDPNGIVEIRAILKDTNQRYGTTIMLSSHLLHEVEQVCNRIAIIHNGKIVAAGTLDALLKDKEMITVQALPFPQALTILNSLQAEGKIPIQKILAEEPEIRLEVASQYSAEINASLVNGGCRVSRLSPARMELGDFFAEITEGQTDVA